MNHIVVADTTPSERLGVDLTRLYRRCIALPIVVPSFLDLYEEYVALYIDAQTDMKRNEIDRQLVSLKDEFGASVFDVENGFMPSEFGISQEFLLLDALMSHQLFFSKDGNLYNQPIVEVW